MKTVRRGMTLLELASVGATVALSPRGGSATATPTSGRPGVAVQLPPQPQVRRRGMTLLELVVAAALLGTILVVCLQLLAATSQQRRLADQRQLALLEVENAMERLAARPWNDLTPQTAAGQLSPSVRSRLPGAELKLEVTTPAAEPLAKRIAVTLRWQDHSGQFTKPLTIVTWRWKE